MDEQLAIDFDRHHREARQRLSWAIMLPLKVNELRVLIACDQLADVDGQGCREYDDPYGTVIVEAKLATLAEAIGKSEDTARRALRSLGETIWVEVLVGRSAPSLVTIDWPSIRRTVVYDLTSGGVATLSAGVAKLPGGVADWTKGGSKTDEKPPPKGGVARGVAKRPHDHEIHKSKSHDNHDHDRACDPASLKPVTTVDEWWPVEVTKELLKDLPRAVELLWPHAVTAYRVQDSEQNRIGFAAACMCVAATARHPGRLLTTLVNGRAWHASGKVAEKYFDHAKIALRPARKPATSDMAARVPQSDNTPDGLRREAAHKLLEADAHRDAGRTRAAKQCTAEAEALRRRADGIEALMQEARS